MRRIKKLLTIWFAVVCTIGMCLGFVSCKEYETKIKEYTGKEIYKIMYSTIDYMGGGTTIKVLDFVNNTYSVDDYYIYKDEELPELTLKKEFSDDDEKIFLDSVYSNGLFDLEERYETFGVDDGGGWTLSIEYADGTDKISSGSNASPTQTFNNCSTYFYDLCGEEILGTLPAYYNVPPSVSCAFEYEIGDYGSGSDNTFTLFARGDYKWNKFESNDNDLFDLNRDSAYNKFLEGQKYRLVLYTSNYSCKEKFNKITVKSYDYNESLTNEKLVYESKWFKQIEFELELNRIYVYELSFKDGDFVQYTFNTKCKASKILFGEYRYNIYQEGYSSLLINERGTFELKAFHYFDDEKNNNVFPLRGEYAFEIIDNKSCIVLYPDAGERIVLEIYVNHLYVNFEHTTYNLETYHLESNSDYHNGYVVFDYNGII